MTRFFTLAACVMAASLVLGAVSASAACSYTDADGNTYDFSSLTKPAGSNSDYTVTKEQYRYNLNVCAKTTRTTQDGCLTESGDICQFDTTQGGSLTAVVAKWDGSPVWSKEATGIKMAFANGAACFPSTDPRKASITFQCAETTGTMQIGSITSCEYDFVFATPLACAGGGSNPSGSKKSKGLSGGWIFIIILLCVIPVYILVGCFVNHRRGVEEGEGGGVMAKCPQRAFWAAIPGLAKEGCSVTFNWIKNMISGCRGGSSGSTDTGSYDNLE